MSRPWYAETAARRHRQIAGDVALVMWAVLWVWLATRLYDLVLNLGAPGVVIESAGQSLADNMLGAGEAIDGVPVVGGNVRAPFDAMSGAGASIADAGRAQQEVVVRLAQFSAVCLAVLPTFLVAMMWIPWRVRFIRRAGAARQFVDNAADLDLFAVRALATQPLHVLARISDDPAGAWRRGDPAVIRALGELELADEGLLPPGGRS